MKRSKADTAMTRAAIIETASKEFRQKGLQLSVPDLMNASGLTHGGFYRHFESKEALITEAARHALRSVIDSLIAAVQDESDKKTALRRVIDQYLSFEHCGNSAGGCVVAALGSELTRCSEDIRQIVLSESSRLIDLVANLLEGSSKDRKASAQVLTASMTGILTVARLMPNEEAKQLLKSARNELVKTYCGAGK